MSTKFHIYKIALCVVCMVLLLTLSACQCDPEEELKAFVHNTKNQPPGPILPLPVLELNDAYTYHAGNLRSPFEPMITTLLTKPSGDVEELEAKGLLEHYPLDSLKMVGTLMRADEIQALIQDGSGMIHAVKINDSIGQHGGKIISIQEHAIEIVEWVMEDGRGLMERKVPINLI